MIFTDGHPLELAPGKTSALLYHLAHQHAWVPREDLLYLFWPDQDESKGRSNLRQLLATLRRTERLEGVEVEIERTRLRWKVRTDLHAFQTALREDRPHLALECYRGPLLEGYRLPSAPEFESWLELERNALHRHWRNATLVHAEHLCQTGRSEEAVGILEPLTSADPLDEQALRVLLSSLARSGRRTEALTRYQAFAETLQAELGVEPETQTQELVQAIREPPPGQAASGPFRPPSRETLPRPPSGFVGRHDELRLLQHRLQQPDCRLITLLAPGGIGKTRLALEAAHRLHTHFRHGTHFVPLVNAGNASIVPTIAESLGIQLATDHDPLPQILAALREWEALLVLDNLEHLAGVGGIIQQILQAAPGIRILATSRARLNLTSEYIIDLAGLPYPPTPHGENLEDYDAVRLFLTRARHLDPNFALATHAQDVARICTLTAGMPLALEFAAAWLRVLPVENIVTELERGLDLLEATEDDVDERHASIRRVFHASWELLSERERDAMLRLSVFRGGFTREAAREATDTGLPLLLALRNKSFLALEPTGRFAQHPLVETYVREQAERGEGLEEARRGHAEYVFAFLARLERFRRQPGEKEAFTAINDERSNVQAAFAWAAHAGRDDLFNHLDVITPEALVASGHEEELLGVVEAALAGVPEGSRGWARLAITYWRLLSLWRRQQDEELSELLHRAFEACRRHGDVQGAAISLHLQGVARAEHEHLEEAGSLWQQARELYQQLGDQARVVTMLHNLSHTTLDPAEKERLYHEAYALAERIGAIGEQLAPLCDRASFLVRTYGDYGQARELLEQAAALKQQLGDDPFWRAERLLEGSVIDHHQGDLARAEAQAHKVQTVLKPFDTRTAQDLRDRAWIQLARIALAGEDFQTATAIAEEHRDTVLRVRLALQRGDHEQAHRLLFARGLDPLWNRSPFFPRVAYCQKTQALLLAADVAIAGGNPNEARQHLREALALACELVYVPSIFEAFVVAVPLLPGDEAEALLILAVTHPAASFDTRQRARHLSRTDPTGMAPSTLTTEEVLERARALLTSPAIA